MKGRRLDLIVYGLAALGLAWYSHHLDGSQTKRLCVSVENLKSGQREVAQATINGDQKLLDDHDQNGTPLPVPRQAILDDIASKQSIVDRYPERKC